MNISFLFLSLKTCKSNGPAVNMLTTTSDYLSITAQLTHFQPFLSPNGQTHHQYHILSNQSQTRTGGFCYFLFFIQQIFLLIMKANDDFRLIHNTVKCLFQNPIEKRLIDMIIISNIFSKWFILKNKFINSIHKSTFTKQWHSRFCTVCQVSCEVNRKDTE